VELLLNVWEKDPKDVKVGNDLQKLTLDILATCIFGLEFDNINGKTAEPIKAYNYCIERVFNPLRFVAPWVNKLPIAWNKKLEANLDIFDK